MSPLVSLLKKDKKNLIIAPESFHEGFFKETLKEDYLYDLSFASETDFIDDVLGYYTIDAAFFLMEEEKISFDAATSLLSSFPFMDNLWKKDLEKFHKSPLNLKTNYENKSIIYLKKAEANPAFLLALNKLKEIGITANSYAFPVCENPNYSFTIYPTIISEVEDLAEKVSALLAQGVKPDSILIEPSDEDYYTVIEDIFSFSQIPYFVNHPLSLYELEDVSRYLEFLKDEKANPTQESLNAFKAKYYLDESVYRALQKAVLTPYASKRESFISLLRSTSFKKKEMSGAIKIGHYFDGYIDDDSYLFILGASLGVFPKPINLMGLLTKEVLSKGNLPSLKELNSNYEDYFINRFLSLKNVILSCPKKTIQREVSPSKIIELIPSIQINEWKINSTRYSLARDYYRYMVAFDNLKNYHAESDELQIFKKASEEYLIVSKPYNPVFSLDDKSLFLSLINNRLKISYSSLDSFYKCPFQYYSNYILNLNNFEISYESYLGNFFHAFIKEYLDKPYDEEEVGRFYESFRDEYLHKFNYSLSEGEAFYFRRFYGLLKDIHAALNSARESSSFKTDGKEKYFEVEKYYGDVKVIFKGTVDLILKDESGNLAILDYKTGSIPQVEIEEGRGMQLFIYYLLLKECSAEPVKLFGLFYVDVPTRISDFKDQKVYLAKGMVKDDPSLMADFDPSHLQIKPSSGYNKFSDEAFQENFDIVKEKTEEAVNNILSLKMAQTPSIDSCRYCAFKEMCYSYQAREEMESSDDEEDDDDASK